MTTEIDGEQALRALLIKLNLCDSLLETNEEGCTFAVYVLTKPEIEKQLSQVCLYPLLLLKELVLIFPSSHCYVSTRYSLCLFTLLVSFPLLSLFLFCLFCLFVSLSRWNSPLPLTS